MSDLADGEANLVCCGLPDNQGVQQVSEADNRGATFSDLFTNAIFRNNVISSSATVRLYVVASLIHVRGLFETMDRR